MRTIRNRIRKAAEEYRWCVSCCILDRLGTADDRFKPEDFPEDLKDMAYWLEEYRRACAKLDKSIKA